MKLLYTSLLITATVAMICASDLSTGINTFSNNLHKTISNDENYIFSPFSAHSALSLAYEGAGGQSAIKLQRVLGLPDANATAVEYKKLMDSFNSAKNVQLNIANKIYIQNNKKLNENFRSIAENYFDAGADTTDFSKSPAAAEEINNWVKEKTHNKIDKLFESDDFDSDTQAVLLNAIYFKGNWLLPFDKEYTREGKFYVSEDKFIMHPMMFQEAYHDYAEIADLDAKMIKLKYENERFAMIIILPNSRTGIADLKQKLFSSNFNINSVKLTKPEEKVLLSLPKFKIESTLKLEDNLKQMGLEEIFTNAANFSNMIEGVQNLKIEKVIQKAFVEVNEEGSEAAAATGIETTLFSLGPPQPVFRADHPFMFYIISEVENDSSNHLFIGKVVSPTYA